MEERKNGHPPPLFNRWAEEKTKVGKVEERGK
jgi:hypothetical protein